MRRLCKFSFRHCSEIIRINWTKTALAMLFACYDSSNFAVDRVQSISIKKTFLNCLHPNKSFTIMSDKNAHNKKQSKFT